MSTVLDDPIHTTWNAKLGEVVDEIRDYFGTPKYQKARGLRQDTVKRVIKHFGGSPANGRLNKDRAVLRELHPELDWYKPGRRRFSLEEMREIHASVYRGEVFEWDWLETAAYWAGEVEW